MKLQELWSAIDETHGIVELKEYLADGGDPNAQPDDSCWTLLHMACEHMNHALVRALVAAGANINLAGRDGWTPLCHAVDIDVDSVWQATHSLARVTFETARLVLELGGDPSVQANNGATVRDIVRTYSDELLVRFDALVTEVAKSRHDA